MNGKKEFSLDWLCHKNAGSLFVLLAGFSCAAALISGCASSRDSASACCCGQSAACNVKLIQSVCPVPATAITPAAPGSIEAQLAVQGKHWRQTEGPIVPGSYVEDVFKCRLNQPQGRGFIGKVISVTEDAATVDFGRGYEVGIFLKELRPISFDERS